MAERFTIRGLRVPKTQRKFGLAQETLQYLVESVLLGHKELRPRKAQRSQGASRSQILNPAGSGLSFAGKLFPPSVLFPYLLALADSSVQLRYLLPQEVSLLLARCCLVSRGQAEQAGSEFVVHKVFVMPLDVGPALWLADAGMKNSEVLDLFQDFADAVSIIVKGLLVPLEVVSVERTFDELLVAGGPEVVFPRLDRDEKKDRKISVEVAPDEFLPVLHLFLAHPVPRVLRPDDHEAPLEAILFHPLVYLLADFHFLFLREWVFCSLSRHPGRESSQKLALSWASK